MAPRKPSHHARESSHRDVMDLIIIISARLVIHEQRVQCLMAEEKAEREKLPILALMHATLGSSRDHAVKPTSASSGQDTQLPKPALIGRPSGPLARNLSYPGLTQRRP